MSTIDPTPLQTLSQQWREKAQKRRRTPNTDCSRREQEWLDAKDLGAAEAHEADADELDAALAKLPAETRTLSEAQVLGLRDYVEWHGAAHHRYCPGDDTCQCPCRPMNDAVNSILSEDFDHRVEALAAARLLPPQGCSCWLGTTATCGSSVARERCPVHGEVGGKAARLVAPPQNPCRTCQHGRAEHNIIGLGECYAELPTGGLCQCHGYKPQSPTPPQENWECGCGAFNGVNLSQCGRCNRSRAEGETNHFSPTPPQEPPS